MNKSPSEPPPLPENHLRNSQFLGDIQKEWLQERKNKILILALIPFPLLIALMMLAIVWSFSNPKGLGISGSSSSNSDRVTTMGHSGAVEKQGTQKKQDNRDGKGKEDDTNIGNSSATSSGLAESNEVSSSDSTGQDGKKIKESVISLPSGTVFGDAVTVALEDPFNPFLESASGKEVVFVIDVSGSMSGDRYNRVSSELIEALQKLKPTQRFNIVLFSTGAAVFRNDGLVVASKEAQDAASGWLKNQFCLGGTDPRRAIEIAIKLTAEKIVILSDGEFDAAIPGYVTSLNRSRHATIDCIGFDPQSFTLKEIALNNGPGRFYAVR
jgi:Mg-chelatase subunit ChlD